MYRSQNAQRIIRQISHIAIYHIREINFFFNFESQNWLENNNNNNKTWLNNQTEK